MREKLYSHLRSGILEPITRWTYYNAEKTSDDIIRITVLWIGTIYALKIQGIYTISELTFYKVMSLSLLSAYIFLGIGTKVNRIYDNDK